MLIAQVVNLARAVDDLKSVMCGSRPCRAIRARRRFTRVDLKGAFALIVGSEGEGVSRLLRDKADFLLRLPMRGQVNR